MRRSVQLVVLACALLALAPAAHAATPRTGKWTGAIGPNQSGQLTFKVSGHRMLKFTVPAAGATCFQGFQAIVVYVPKATISSSGRFSTTFHPTANSTIKLKGKFTSSRKASGSVVEQGPCDTNFLFNAKPGNKPPSPPTTVKTGCQPTPCGSVQGTTLFVTGHHVYTSAVQQPHPGKTIYEVDARLEDNSDPAYHPNQLQFQLIDSTGGARGAFDCVDNPNRNWPGSAPTMSPGTKYGPVPLCFEIDGPPSGLKLTFAPHLGERATIPLG